MNKGFYLIFLILQIFQIRVVKSACAPPDPPAPCFTQEDFNVAFSEAENVNFVTEEILVDNYKLHGFLLEEHDATFEHFRQHKVPEFVIGQNRYTTVMTIALQSLKTKGNYTKQQLRRCLRNIIVPDWLPKVTLNCLPSATNYYRPDGQCNNLQNPLLGSLYTPFIRLLEDSYEDGLESMPKSRMQESPRSDSNVANTARGMNENLSPETTSDMATMAFQILTHEMMGTKKVQLHPDPRGGGFDCCNAHENPLLTNLIKINKYCLPIKVADEDTCYAGKAKCLNYIRSFRAFDQWNLTASPTQINFHTPYIDFELIYNELSLQHLNSNKGLFDLKNNTKMKEILVGFDVRSMQLPGLFLYLSYYIRLHNEIIKEFQKVKPRVPFPLVLLETRKIVTAVFQKISVDLVNSVMDFPAPPTKCYNPTINPQISVEFNIAFRVFHYFIRDKMGIYDSSSFKIPFGLKGKMPTLIDQSALIDNLTLYIENKCGLMHGLIDTSWNLGGLGDGTRCKFFSKDNQTLGTDLRSMDFMYGREIGEPSYVSFLRKIGKLKKCDGDVQPSDLKALFDNGTLNFLAKRYDNKMTEMPLTVGLDFEARNGAILEPGVQSIIFEQMTRTICGDRFWYNHEGGIFTKSQRDKINRFDINVLLCVLHDCNDTRIQFFPFMSAGINNKKAFCFTTPDIIGLLDLKNW